MAADPAGAVVLQSIRVKADQILVDLETRMIDGLAALDELAALVREKLEAKKQANESGLSSIGFAVFWTLSRESAAEAAAFDALTAAREIETVLAKFPTWHENSEERRRLRAQLYKPLLALPKNERADAIDKLMQVLEKAS
jgi:type I restriction enzyme R subunit